MLKILVLLVVATVHCETEPDYVRVPNIKNCWTKCERKGGKCDVCGPTGWCCRKGNMDCPAHIADAGLDTGHSCVAPAPPKQNCTIPVNVGFLLDSSGSLGKFYQTEKDFVKNVVEHFHLDETGSRASVITFSKRADYSIKFNEGTQSDAFNAKVDAIPHMNSFTYIDRAMNLALDEMFKESNGALPDRPKVLILLTDGKQSKKEKYTEPSVLARKIRNRGIILICVGIGDGVDYDELINIAGRREHAFHAKDFDQLMGTEFIDSLTNETCELVKDTCTSVKPCKNGATCKNTEDGYQCQCKSGYTGQNCETVKDTCTSVKPCKNGATCKNTEDGYQCQCKSGYTGQNCETDINECAHNPCKNNGRCVNSIGSYRCQCGREYTGTHCEKINPNELRWYCAVKKSGGITARTRNLRTAQASLGQGNNYGSIQAIIPMTGRKSGDPHTLPKGWGSGSMWWWGRDDINNMRATCHHAQVPIGPVNEFRWYCAVEKTWGITARTRYLRTAQASLAHGNRNNVQAIIPMTGRESGDPHTLSKGWGSGSMWWGSWDDINNMRAKCHHAQVPIGPVDQFRWYCAITIDGGVKARTRDLRTAQRELGHGNRWNRQAIIPMTGRVPGDPHTLAKGWGSGSMWWSGWGDINNMREICQNAGVPN